MLDHLWGTRIPVLSWGIHSRFSDRRGSFYSADLTLHNEIGQCRRRSTTKCSENENLDIFLQARTPRFLGYTAVNTQSEGVLSLCNVCPPR